MGRALLGDADMTDTPKDPPELTSDNKDCAMTTDHDEPHSHPDDTPPPEPPKENLIHFNPWRDFNDAAPMADVFGDEPDPDQIAHSWRWSLAIATG